MSKIAFMDTWERTPWRRYTPRQIQVLKEVKEKKTIYPYGLAKAGHPYSSVQRIVEGFVKEDLLWRIAGRPVTYELTPKGERLVQECQDIFFVDQKGIHGDPLIGRKEIHSNSLPSHRWEHFPYKLRHLQGSPVDLAIVGQQIATHRECACKEFDAWESSTVYWSSDRCLDRPGFAQNKRRPAGKNSNQPKCFRAEQANPLRDYPIRIYAVTTEAPAGSDMFQIR